MKAIFAFTKGFIGFLTGTTLLVAFVGLVFALVGFGHFTYQILTKSNSLAETADAIVVLTGGKDRIKTGAELLREKRAGKLLITGVNRQVGQNSLAKSSGITNTMQDCCVVFDYEAQDTVGNARQASAWAKTNKFESLIIVTNDYHMPRSLFEMRKAMPGTKIVPHSVRYDPLSKPHWYRELSTIRLLAAEYSKYLVTTLRAELQEATAKVSKLAESIRPQASS